MINLAIISPDIKQNRLIHYDGFWYLCVNDDPYPITYMSAEKSELVELAEKKGIKLK